jgi:hypothetical protein
MPSARLASFSIWTAVAIATNLVPIATAELRDQLVTLARQKPRYGYRRLWAVLSRRGHKVNVKCIYRLYRQANLAVRRLRRKRLGRTAPVNTMLAPNQEWALDFVADGVGSGRGIRILTMVDGFTRECPAREVGVSVCGRRPDVEVLCRCSYRVKRSPDATWRQINCVRKVITGQRRLWKQHDTAAGAPGFAHVLKCRFDVTLDFYRPVKLNTRNLERFGSGHR